MFFVYDPYAPSPAYFDPEQAYEDYRRRQYVTTLQEQQRRAQFERELALEEERHRRALAVIAQQETGRRQRQTSPRHPREPQQHISGACVCGQDAGTCVKPDSQEIFRRRQARQQEEEDLSREFHKQILSQIFGVPLEEMEEPTTEDSPITPMSSIVAQGKEATANRSNTKDTPAPQIHAKSKESIAKEPTTKASATKERTPKQANTKAPATTTPGFQNSQSDDTQPHWSAAPDRARALAELTSVTRAFTSLKNTFVFPPGPLNHATDTSGAPRLVYNQTNAAIHAYQYGLSELLTKLDGIDSYGFNGVREARKQLVVKIETEMEDLEKKIAQRLAESPAPSADQGDSTSTNATPPKKTENAKVKDAVDSSTPATTKNDAPAPSASNDAATQVTMAEATAFTGVSQQKEHEDVVVGDGTESSAPEAMKTTGGYDIKPNEPVPQSVVEAVVPVEKPTIPSVSEMLASTEVESQAASKEAMGAEVPVPENSNPSISADAPIADKGFVLSENPPHPISPAASHPTSPHAKSFTVSDDDSEIEDAVKTVV